MDVLGPVWFYVAAFAAWMTTSLSAYFGCLGAVAATKFAIAYAVGLKWRDSSLAIALVAASALPGLTSYQLFGVSHPQMLEAMIWACAWFVLQYRANQRWRNAVWAGVFAALALHAHPTAIFLLPWMCLGLIARPTVVSDQDQTASSYHLTMARALLCSLVGAAAIFSPRFLFGTTPLASANPSDALVYTPTVAELISSVMSYGVNMSWTQTQHFVQTVRPQSEVLLMIILAALILVTLLGCWAALRERTLRGPLLAAVLTWVLCVIGAASLRSHTPFYMLFVALPPFVAVLAISWRALHGLPAGAALFIFATSSTLTLHVLTSMSVFRLDQHMPFVSRLPPHGNMKITATESHRESYVTAKTRDEVARWICAQPTSVALHGDVATALDVSFQIEVLRTCGAKARFARLGGSAPAWVGLPLSVLDKMGVVSPVIVGGYGLAPAAAVLSPTSALPPSSGSVYPPRLAAMLGSGQSPQWNVEFQSESGSAVVVSSLLSIPSLFATVVANGVSIAPLESYSGTRVYVCGTCAVSTISWRVSITGSPPGFTSIATVARDSNQEPARSMSTIRSKSRSARSAE